MALKNSDLFVVNRDFKSYRVNVAQMKEYLGDGFTEIGVPLEPIIITPEEGAGFILTTGKITAVDPVALTLEVEDNEDFNKLEPGNFVFMTGPGGTAAYYKLKTSKVIGVTDVSAPAATSYDIKVDEVNPDNDPPGNYHDLPLLVAGQPIANRPSNDVKWVTLYTKLNSPSIPYFVRYAGQINGSTTNLWSSDDGVNWDLEGSFTYLPGVGNDLVKGTRPRTYFAWKFNYPGGNGKVRNYGIDKISTAPYAHELEFESPNADLQYFRPGDEVGSGSAVSYNLTQSNPNNLSPGPDHIDPLAVMDGDLGTFYLFYESKNSTNSFNGSITLTFPGGIKDVTSLRLAVGYSSKFDQVVDVEVNGVAGTVPVKWASPSPIPLNVPILPNGIPSTINSVTVHAGYGSVAMAGLEVNGVVLTGSIEVESTDLTNNKMVVIGEGIEVGDILPKGTAELVKHGEGTVLSKDIVNGVNTLYLDTTNDEWIGPNHDDTPFYATHANSALSISSSITSVGTNQVTTLTDDSFSKMQAGDQVWMSDQNGKVASHTLKTSQIKTVTPTSNGLELEFDGFNPDLQYFRQGDVVNAEVFAGTELCFTDHPQGFNSSYPASNAHDGDTSTQSKLATTGTAYTYTIDIASVAPNYTGEIDIWMFSSKGFYEYWVVYEDGTESPKITPTASGQYHPIGTNGKVIKYLKSGSNNNGATPAFNAFSLNGGKTAFQIDLDDRDAADEGVVDSVDLVNNKMTLIGGAFEVGDTVPKADVPAFVKSGDAIVLKAEVTGGQNVITFQTSNDEWIGPNINNTPFFVSLKKADAPTTSTLEILTSDFELDVPNTATHESTTYKFTNMISGDVMVHEFSPGITKWVPGSAILAPFTEYELVVTYGASSGNSTDSEVRSFKTGDVTRSGGPGPVMYDENTYDTVDGADATAKYGIKQGQLPRVGIYPTVDLHPELPILHYTRVGDHYLAVHDKRPRYQSLIDDLNDSISSINI